MSSLRSVLARKKNGPPLEAIKTSSKPAAKVIEFVPSQNNELDSKPSMNALERFFARGGHYYHFEQEEARRSYEYKLAHIQMLVQSPFL